MSIPLFCGFHRLFRSPATWFGAAVACTLVACGGGDSTDDAGTSTPTQALFAASQAAPGVDSFFIEFNETVNTVDALAEATGGPVIASWNPVGSPQFYQPGLRISFFGDPIGCKSGTKTGLAISTDSTDTKKSEAAATAENTTPALGWTPSGNTDGCSNVADRSGPSMVVLDQSKNALRLVTVAGQRDDAKLPFFAPFGSGGQNGAGTNSNIIGTYLAFRQNWRKKPTVVPWRVQAPGVEPVARLRVDQSIGKISLGSSSEPKSQVQQVYQLHIINQPCRTQIDPSVSSCQMNYLFTGLIASNVVSDWSSRDRQGTADVWYDAAQGGNPIVEGQVRGPGEVTREKNTGLPLFTSAATATRHSESDRHSLDIRISLSQLENALRILAGRRLDKDPATVTENELAAHWGAAWNSPDAWVVESLSAGQEIYNKDVNNTNKAEGAIHLIYMGPARP